MKHQAQWSRSCKDFQNKQTNTLDLTNCIVFCLGNYQIENDDDDESMKQKNYRAL